MRDSVELLISTRFPATTMNRLSGIELCKKIRIENQICIIHAMTGYNNIFGLLECRAAGFDNYFVKPVRMNLLKKAAQDAFCWRQRRGAKSGGTGSVIIGDWIKVSLAADFSKSGDSPFP